MFIHKIKKLLWFIDAYISSKKYPLNQSLIYIGVTGTDGKTTTTSFIYEMAKELGYKPLLITTVGAKFNGEEIDANIKTSTFWAYSIKEFKKNLFEKNFIKALKNLFFLDREGYNNQVEKHRTTPLSSEIRKLILKYESLGADFFIIETTSHAIDQSRIYGIKFDSVGFTNITNDHLDYHKTWENYADTKLKILNNLKESGSIIINKNDEKSFTYIKNKIKKEFFNKNFNLIETSINDLDKINIEKFFITISKDQNLQIKIQSTSKKESYQASLKLLGQYNLFNALTAYATVYGTNDSNPTLISNAIKNLEEIPGRMQLVHESPNIIVDFAHTSNGIRTVLSNLKLKDDKARLWVVFGCAGLRDKFKRPEIGKSVYEFADNILITAEDPRTEKLIDINNDIIKGFKYNDDEFVIQSYYEGLEYINEGKFIVRFDEPNLNSRKNAIKYAIDNAAKIDTILLLGKGHETSINFDGIEYDWNDIEFVKEYLNSK